MIEAASRSLRQQMNRSVQRPAAASKGNPSDGAAVDEPRSAENAQRRIRSAENQHRSISAQEAPQSTVGTVAPTPSTSALDNYTLEDDVEEDATGSSNLDDVPRVPHDFPQELKRPASRKKDPSASAAAGLGAFAGPSRMTDAFEQRKTRQPIPVESWGPRPPSRAGLPQKASTTMDASLGDGFVSTPCRGGGSSSSVGRASKEREPSQGGSRPSSKMATGEQARSGSKTSNEQAFGAKVVGGTWAAARVEPRAVQRPLANEARNRGRERRATTQTRGTPEVGAADLGVFGRGQPMAKSLSGVLDSGQFRGASTPGSRAASRPEALADPLALGVSGCGLGDAGPGAWPSSPQSCSGTPPTRRGRYQSAEPMQMEDVEGPLALAPGPAAVEEHGLHPGFRRTDAAPPQVIVTRSSQTGQSRGHLRRSVDQRAMQPRDRNMPFSTSLDVDFLSLFAS